MRLNDNSLWTLKPVESIENLLKIFTPFATHSSENTERVENLRFESSDGLSVVLLTAGSINVYRTSDNLLYATATAPFILGMYGSLYQYKIYRFQLNENSNFKTIPLKKCLSLVLEHNALKDLIRHQAYLSDYATSRSALLINKSAYEIVRGLLYEIRKLPADIRLKTSVINYIISRSNLAKSGVDSILSALRKGGYIHMDRGKLVSVLRTLPQKY